jgi:hypothetical protein
MELTIEESGALSHLTEEPANPDTDWRTVDPFLENDGSMPRSHRT